MTQKRTSYKTGDLLFIDTPTKGQCHTLIVIRETKYHGNPCLNVIAYWENGKSKVLYDLTQNFVSSSYHHVSH